MGKRKQRIKDIGFGIRTTVELGLVAAVIAYTQSEKIGYITHETQNQLITNLDLKKNLKSDTLYRTDDRETNTILNMMSGYTEQAEIQRLIDKYGDGKICIDSISLPDPALYKTIWKMHQKYGNAHIKFRGNYTNLDHAIKNFFFSPHEKLPLYEHKRARYNVLNNTMHLYNLDSISLNFSHCTNELKKKYAMVYEVEDDGQLPVSSIRDEKRYLINNWMMELTHAYQTVGWGASKVALQGSMDYLAGGFNYDKTYKMNGAIEHEAHNTIQPLLIEEFIETYIHESDTTDPQQCFFIAMLYNGYFDNSHNVAEHQEKSMTWLKKVASHRNKDVNFMIGKKLMQTFIRLEDSLGSKQKDSIVSSAMHYLELAAKQGSPDAVSTIVETSKMCYLPQCVPSAIKWQHYILTHPERFAIDHTAAKQNLAKGYMVLSELYGQIYMGHEQKIYKKKAEELGFDSSEEK